MTIDEQFLDQLTHFERSAPAPPELLPSRLAASCFEVLPVAGAAISVFTAEGLRFPVGASGPRAAYAERLQFATGEGPCLDLRTHRGNALHAGDRTISRCWPRFHALLLRHTPYRAVAALPLVSGARTWATVDLFFGSDEDLHRLPVADAIAVADVIGSMMLTAFSRWSTATETPVSAARHLTVTAMGLLNTGYGLTAEESLSALLTCAGELGMTVDALADASIHGRRSFDDVSPPRTPTPRMPQDSSQPAR